MPRTPKPQPKRIPEPFKCPECRVGNLYWQHTEATDRKLGSLPNVGPVFSLIDTVGRDKVICPECGAGWNFKWEHVSQVEAIIAGLTGQNRIQ